MESIQVHELSTREKRRGSSSGVRNWRDRLFIGVKRRGIVVEVRALERPVIHWSRKRRGGSSGG